MATLETNLALSIFAFVASITPGPNNIMLFSSGANYGFRRTIPHILGINLGFTLLIILTGVGLMQLFELFPAIHTALQIFSGAYLLYLAYKIASAGAPSSNAGSESRPFSFIQAALFQWVNPKAWTMALTAISLHGSTGAIASCLFIAVIFMVINLPCICAWTVVGQKFNRIINNPRRLKVFNFSMAFLLVVTLVQMTQLS
jgi:threonine/homoserine/homoserine lactone efflux protein